jgi:hypothetical protein
MTFTFSAIYPLLEYKQLLKITAIWNEMPRSLVEVDRHFTGVCTASIITVIKHHHPDVGGSTHL